MSKIAKESILLLSLFLIAAMVQFYRAVAADGALLVLSADFVFGLSLRTPARDSHRLRLHIPRRSAQTS